MNIVAGRSVLKTQNQNARSREAGSVNYYPMPEIDTADVHGIEKLFTGLVFKMLLEEGMISGFQIPWSGSRR